MALSDGALILTTMILNSPGLALAHLLPNCVIHIPNGPTLHLYFFNLINPGNI